MVVAEIFLSFSITDSWANKNFLIVEYFLPVIVFNYIQALHSVLLTEYDIYLQIRQNFLNRKDMSSFLSLNGGMKILIVLSL